MIEKGVALVTYNRSHYLPECIESILSTLDGKTKFVLCDDGSQDDTLEVVRNFKDLIYLRGPNKGVGPNKNRALWALQDCAFIAILEDDLLPRDPGWFKIYQDAAIASGIHHFCRVQDKLVEETIPEFSDWMISKGMTPIYGPSPRGDFTFITNRVLQKVGGINPEFLGAGYAHGHWSYRIEKAGLIPHPLKWVDILEANEKFYQKGDTEGGRWLEDKRKIKEQLKRNGAIAKNLRKSGQLFSPLILV